MSKNIVIKKVGTAQTFTGIYRVNLHRNNGDTEDWVPEDETRCTDIEITANGVYTAAELGVYGWNTVHVHVPKDNQVVGYGEDGNAYKVTTDGDGVIVRTAVPSSIVVTTQPTKQDYHPGETIVYTGIVVTLKNKDGTTFADSTYTTGAVPTSELIFTVPKAQMGMANVPVYWKSPYTNRVMRALVTLNVTPAPEPEEEGD